MNYKKLLTTLVFVLGAWMSVGVANAQQTNYDFSAITSIGTITATFTEDTSLPTFTNAGGTFYEFSGIANVALNGNPLSGVAPDWGTANNYYGGFGISGNSRIIGSFIFANPSASLQYYSLQVNNQIHPLGTFTSNGGTLYLYNSFANAFSASISGGNQFGSGYIASPPAPTSGVTSIGWVTASAPEIDGALAPKVGFLLGCLFLMFGRKKQNAESMMTA